MDGVDDKNKNFVFSILVGESSPRMGFRADPFMLLLKKSSPSKWKKAIREAKSSLR